MQSALHEIEHLAYEEEIQGDLPKSWRERFKGYILNPKADDLEGKLMAAADIIDTILEAVEEVKLGNNAFEPILIEVTELLLSIEADSVNYFIRYALHDFGLDIRSFYGDKVADKVESLHFSKEIFERS